MTPFELFIPDAHLSHFNARGVAEHVVMHVQMIQRAIEKQFPNPEPVSVTWSVRPDQRTTQGEGISIRAEVE